MSMGLASECIKNDVAELVLSKLENVQQIIHYEGQITEVINTTLGIYELDKKLQLYFSILDKLTEDLQIDDHILLSNVHIISVNSHKFLVCCALSSMKRLSGQTVITIADEGHILEEHKACFPDLFMKYNFINFNSYIAKQFLWNSFYNHRLKTSICDDGHANTNQNHFRKWDQDVFKEPFGKDYLVPSISFLVSEAKSRIVWSKHSTKWDHATVLNNELYVLVGFLYLKENGRFELSDSYNAIPCVFMDDFTPGSDFERDFVCEVSSGRIGYYVALRKYCFVFEKFFDGHGMTSSYICTSVSYVLPLEQVSSINRRSFCRDHNFSKSSLYDSEIEGRHAECSKQYDKSSTLPFGCERTDISVITTMFKENLSISVSDKDARNRKTLKTKYLCLEFKVLLKSWSSEKNKLVYKRAFVFVLNQKPVYVDNEDFSSFIELPNGTEFSETGTKSDEELVKLMKNLQLQQELQSAVLNFIGSSSKTCSNLRPGHIYRMFIPYRCNMFSSERKKIDFYSRTNKDYGPRVIFINVDRNVKILHSSECFLNKKLADNLSDDHTFEVTNVKDIIKKKNVLTCNVVEGILVDKSFETDFNSQSDKILRVTLKDLETADSIPIYISCYPRSLNGLLPGVVLKLIGCQCISSQKGYLYLRSADLFGFHVSNMHHSSVNIIFSQSSSINNEDTKIFMLKELNSRACPMTFECFNGLVLKITRAQLSYVCMKCFDCMEKKCPCDSEYMEMTEVSFDVNDGSNVVSMHGTSNVLRTLLMLDQNEWNAVIKHVFETKRAMKYNYLERSKIPRAFMPKLFHCLCSNTAISRPVYLNCSLQTASDGRNCLTNSCICWNLSEICVQDIAARLYITLTK